MLGTLFWILVGALIAWNFPQPAWAKWFQSWLGKKWKAFRDL